MSKVGGRRNFGYGKSLAWAGKNALKGRYGEGHYATRAAHAARWKKFAEFAKDAGVRDARDVTREVIDSYTVTLATRVQSGLLSVRYAQNLLSSVNVVMERMRGDTALRVRPASAVGHRSNVRTEPPVSLDRVAVVTAIQSLEARGHHPVACIALLARDLGLRFREASLLDARSAAEEAARTGIVTVSRGTKGGRGRELGRTVPASPEALASLQRAANLQGHRDNLIPEAMNFKSWRDHAYGVWRPIARSVTPIAGFHDLRAAYACERYAALTGRPAPVIAGQRLADRQTDRTARQTISQELGHHRSEVVAAYIGSGR
jgi:hypothetical protein